MFTKISKEHKFTYKTANTYTVKQIIQMYTCISIKSATLYTVSQKTSHLGLL